MKNLRTLILLVLAALSFSAAAQIVHPLDPVPFTKGACEPAGVSGGTGTKSTLVQSVAGYEGEYWWCPGHSLYARTLVMVVKRSSYVTQWPDGWRDMNMRAFVDALWLSNKPADCNDLAATGSEDLAPICAATREAAAKDPARPAHPTWVATTNGAYPTRAVYTAHLGDDGAVTFQTIKGQTANVGEACECHVMAIRVGTQTRCPVARGLTTDRDVTLSVDGVPTPGTARLRAFSACSRAP